MGSENSGVPAKYRLGDFFVPKERYTDPEFLQREYDELFPKVWQTTCRLEEIPNRGDFFEYTIGKESIIIVRTGEEKGDLKAYFNTCPHRGARLAEGEGNISEFRCPYHGWRFNLEGDCTYIHEINDFKGKITEKTANLAECLVDSWGGWVFINMDLDAEPLLEWLEPLPKHLDPFLLENMRYRWYKTVIAPTNWKNVIDAFIEGYHVGGTHPQTVHPGGIDHSPATIAELPAAPYAKSLAFENHSRFFYGYRPDDTEGDVSSTTASSLSDIGAIIGAVEYNCFQLGALNSLRDVRAARKMRDMDISEGDNAYEILERLRKEEAEADGIKWPQVTKEEYAGGQGDWHVFPTMVGLYELGSALGYRVRPNGDDPNSCIFDIWSLELYPEGEEPELDHQFFDRWEDHDGWGLLLPQDFRNFPDITVGQHSRGFAGLRLNPEQESSVYNAHVIADRFLFGEKK